MIDVIPNFTIPFIMIVMSLLMKGKKAEYPGRKRAMIKRAGYRSNQALGSKEKWDFAQIIASKIILRFGIMALIFEVICSVIIIVLDPNIKGVNTIAQMLSFIFLFGAFYKIEKNIKIQFK